MKKKTSSKTNYKTLMLIFNINDRITKETVLRLNFPLVGLKTVALVAIKFHKNFLYQHLNILIYI